MTARVAMLLIHDLEAVEEWCRQVRVLFDRRIPFLVGSAIYRVDFRDVDIRMILPDAEFDAAWSDPVKVRYMNRAVSMWGAKATGLPIDFQIQRQTEANAQNKGEPVLPMGGRDWRKVRTSGVPAA